MIHDPESLPFDVRLLLHVAGLSLQLKALQAEVDEVQAKLATVCSICSGPTRARVCGADHATSDDAALSNKERV